MAYYSYRNHEEGETNYGSEYCCFLNSNSSTYYPVPFQNQDSFTGSSYSCNSAIDFQIFAYDPIPSKFSYSVSFPTEPENIEYDPAAAAQYSNTQFSISYSVSEFNEAEFEDYDPTPYGGGYDLVRTYGNPLPPSEETCYPRSAAAVPLNSLPSAPIATPAGKIEDESKAASIVAENGAVSGESEPTAIAEESDVVSGVEESNSPSKSGSGSSGGDGYGHGMLSGQMPYGYGLEAMDICDSLFGYWPCIARYRRRLGDYEEAVESGNCRDDPWNGTADYLFGNPNPYEERRYGFDDENGYGTSLYGYEMHQSLDH